MRVLGYLGMLAAAVVLLVAMVTVVRGVASGTGGGKASSGSQKALNELNKDKEAPLDDPKDEIRGAIRDVYGG